MTKWHNFCTSCYECSNALQHFLLTKVVGKQFFHKIFFQQILCIKLLLVLAKRLEAIRWALILAKSIEAAAMIVESDSKDYVCVWILRLRLRFAFHVFSLLLFLFNPQLLTSQLWTVHPCTVHGSQKLHFSATFSLKMGPTALFTHLKIILLQCFQFSVSVK